MHPKFLALFLSSVALLPLSSCDNKENKENKDVVSLEASAKSEEHDNSFILAPRIVRNDGSFELLVIIEGLEPNRQFVNNLQLIANQRASLKKLKEQADKTEEDTQKTETLEKKLKENADMMLKLYGYNISADYIFIPMHSSLVKVVDDKKERIRNFDTPNAYNKLKVMHGKYAALEAKGGESSAEAQAIAEKLMKEFSFDVKSNCTIEINKSALYRKVN
jgi:hypothetical protein